MFSLLPRCQGLWGSQGAPATAHWGYPDPSEVQGSEDERLEAFRRTLHAIHRRIELLIALPPQRLERAVLEGEARNLSAA